MTPANGSGAPLLSVAGVHTFYGSIEALRGVDVEIRPGEIVTLIGANGAGKSTLLRVLNRLARQVRASGIREVSGDVAIDNRLWKPYDGWPDGQIGSIWVNENPRSVSRLIRTSRTRCATPYCL